MRVGEVATLQLDDIDWRRASSNLGISAQHFGRPPNVAVSFSQSSQPADFAIARDSSGEG
jgi:hypothetical protein